MAFAQILCNIMDKRNITAYRISKDIGISDSLIGYWRKGEKQPTAENLSKIAEYLNVSVDLLLGIEKPAAPDGEQPVNKEIAELLSTIQDLSEEEAARVKDYIQLVVQQRKQKP